MNEWAKSDERREFAGKRDTEGTRVKGHKGHTGHKRRYFKVLRTMISPSHLKAAAWCEAYTNAVPLVSFVPLVPSKALQAKKNCRIPLGEAEPVGAARRGYPPSNASPRSGCPSRGATTKKLPATSYSRTGESRTTLGDGALNFCVRNGNRCDNPSMVTGKKAVQLGTKENYNFSRCDLISL